MAVSVADPHDTQAAQAAAANPMTSPVFQTAVQQTLSDLNTGNYLAAWNTAEGTDKLFGTPTNDAATKDPLLMAMQSSAGLQALDPTKVWNAQSNAAYYTALGQSQGYTGSNDLGKNPYGLWGSQGATQNGTDSSANIAQAGMTPDVERFAGAAPTSSFLSKYGGLIGAVALTAITMGAAAPLAGAVLGATTAVDVGIAGAAIGAAGTAVLDVATGKPITAGSIAGGALSGIGASGALTGLGNTVGAATGLGNVGGGALVGAGMGAAGAALRGGNVGLGAFTGGASGAIQGAQIGSQVSGAAGGGMLGNIAGNAATGGLKYGVGLAGNSLFGNSAQSGGNNMMGSNSGNTISNLGNILSSAGSLAGPIMSGMGASQSGSMFNNAYSTAGSAGAAGQNFGFNGLGGMGGTFNNGQLNLNSGAFGGAGNQFSQFANSQGGMANQYGNGNVPTNVTQGFNQFNTQVGQGIGTANAGAAGAAGVMGMGTNTLGSANANYAGAYNTSLNSALAALNPQIQQQSNALLNSNFERGMSGTSGGALQTQALQNSFNTANLQAQNQAVGQGLNAFNSTISAGTGMFNSGAGQLGNFNNQGVNFGAQGMQGAMGYNSFSPQLAGMYQTNANAAGSGASTINNMMLGNFQAGMGATGQMGTLENNASNAQTNAGRGFNAMGNGMYGNIGSALGTPGAVSGLLSGASSLFNGLSGLGSSAFSNSGWNMTPAQAGGFGSGDTVNVNPDITSSFINPDITATMPNFSIGP